MTPEQQAAKKRAIEGFRLHLAARGLRGYLLSDAEVWQMIENLIENMNWHVAMRNCASAETKRAEC